MTSPRIYVYFWDDRFVYVAPDIQRQRTRRYAVTLLLSLGRQPIRVDAGVHGKGDFRALLVAPNIERSAELESGGYFSLNLDPQSYGYHILKRSLGTQGIQALDIARFKTCLPRLRALLAGGMSTADAFDLSADLIAAISDQRPADLAIDLRVLHVARGLRAQMSPTLQVERLAADVGLSPGRLKHLFSEQMGVPMKSYLLWARMRRAGLMLHSGVPLTEVAHRMGFYDQAHFSRLFKRFVGLTPSSLERSTDVQVLIG